MNPIFEHPVLDSVRERVKCVINNFKNHRTPLKTCFTLVSTVGATRYFLLQNRSGLHTREHKYSTSVLGVTINGGMDVTDYAASIG